MKSRDSAGRTALAPASAATPSAAALKSPGRQTPTKWSNNFFKNLFGYEWELTKSPAGAHQWKPKGDAGARHGSRCARSLQEATHPSMLTTDLSLRFDPAYEKISRRFLEHPGRVRRRLCPRLVQAHAPRHGSALPLPRPAGAQRRADLAGSGSRRRSRTRSTTRTSKR